MTPNEAALKKIGYGAWGPDSEDMQGLSTAPQAEQAPKEEQKADWTKAAADASKAAGSAQGSSASKVGQIALSAAPATGPAAPYVAGAGAGLMTIGMVQDARNAEAQAEYEAELQRWQAQNAAMDRLAQISKGFKAL